MPGVSDLAPAKVAAGDPQPQSDALIRAGTGGENTLRKPEDDTTGPARPSALLQNLAAIATRASGAHRKFQDARYGNSSGAASAGKRLTSWSCACGWTGAAQELRVSVGGLGCPSCDGTGGLKPA